MTARDVQRSDVYEAEGLVRRIFDRADKSRSRTVEAYGSTITLPVERRFASVESMQRYVDLVLELNWVRSAWPARAAIPALVRERRGQTQAHYARATSTIAIPPHDDNRAWAMRELVLLHELAHHLEPDNAAAPHGPQFAGRFETLVTEIVGPEAGLLLRSAMHESGVRMAVDAAIPL